MGAKFPSVMMKDDAVFAEGRTEAVFQFESSGMQEICRKLKPKGLEDLAALTRFTGQGLWMAGWWMILLKDIMAKRPFDILFRR